MTAVNTITLRDELIEALTYAWHSLRKAEGEGRGTAAIRELIDDLLDDLHEVG